jgi:hypothetical protein
LLLSPQGLLWVSSLEGDPTGRSGKRLKKRAAWVLTSPPFTPSLLVLSRGLLRSP